MGLRFRRSINLGGGFKINLSGSGIGYSWGVKGFRVTKTSKGATRMTASIPGTGISYVKEAGVKKRLPTDNEPYYPKNTVEGLAATPTFNGSVDDLLVAAIKCVMKEGIASTALLQRRLKLGYAPASALIDRMEHMGIVGQFNGSHPRHVLIQKDQFDELLKSKDLNEGVKRMERLKLIGQSNRILLVKDDTIKIVDLGGLFSSMKKEKLLSVCDVTGVEVKKPDFYVGYIQLQVSGQLAPNEAGRSSRKANVYSAVSDENSVTFVGEENYQIALAIQSHIQSYNAQHKNSAVASAPSNADEILKYKALLDSGVITEEEFSAKKTELLNMK